MKDKDKPSQKGSTGPTGARTAEQAAPATIAARFQVVFDSSRDAIGVSKAGIHVFVNPAYLELFGFPPGTDLAGKPILDLIAPASRDQIREHIRRRVRGESAPASYETRGRHVDGSEFDMEVNVSLYQENGEDQTLVILRDITQRKTAEQEIAERGARLQQIMDTANVAIFQVDRSGRIVHANRRMAQMFGCSMEELVGSEYVDHVHPSERETGRRKMLALLASEIPAVDLERLYWRQDGTQFWGHLAGRRFHDAQGNELGLIGVITDLSVRKQSELALQQSEAKYRRLYNETPVLLQSIDRDARLVDVNDYWLKTMGYERSEVIGRKVTDFYTAESRKYAEDAVHPAFFRDGSAKDVAYHFVKKNGAVVDVLLSATAERDAADAVVRSLAVIVDVTDRKRAEQALRENQARLNLALQSAHMGVWRWEIKEGRRYIDDQGYLLLGIDAATFTGTAAEFLQAVHPEDRGKIKAALARTLEQDAPYEPTYRVVWPDGTIRHITARGQLVRDELRQPVRINGILWDITDQHLLEQERIKTQKLESVGTLAGGIAHDFNNLLQGVFGFISMARLTHNEKQKSLAMLEQAEKALHQSVNLTSQLLAFSKGGKPVKKVVDLRPLIENSVAFALSGSRITAEIVMDQDLRAVEADEGQIGQVIRNIVLNADQAMPLGGIIRVSARNISAAAIVPPADLQGDLVEISIRDQGLGIPAEHLTRIFDPYFTTKEKGSGLGLATSYAIVKNHEGLVRVQTEVGKGATFIIYLPASGAQAEETDRPAIPAATRKGRILVMDDEEIIRIVAGEMLAALGHEAASAETGETAMEAYRAARDADRPFDVVILDLTIRGGMGGVETLRKLVEIDPDVKAVVSSGYSDDAALANYRELGFRAFLKKPYHLQDLQNIIGALLDRVDDAARL